MALKKNSAEGGTNGVTVTTGNSGGASGDALAQVTITGSPTAVFSNTLSAHGSMSYHISGVSGDTAKFYLGSTAGGQGAMRGYIYFPTLPSSAQAIFNIQNSSFSGITTVNISAAGKLTVTDGSAVQIFITTVALSAATWYRIEVQVITGTTTSNGTINFQYFAGDSTSAIQTFSSSAVNTTTTNALRGQLGKQTSGVALDAYFDDFAYDDTTSTPIGPYSVSNSAPTCSAGADQIDLEPYTTITLTGTDNDSDGTVASRAWRQISGSPTVSLSSTTVAVVTYTAPGTIAGTTLVFGYQVTDNLGSTSTEDTISTVILPVTERAVIGGVEVPVHTQVASGGALV